ncbi:reverse transcriptase domain-containing protein [Tanacetum coccineum]
MSTRSSPSPTTNTSVVRNTVGRRKEKSQENPNEPAFDAALREFCDKNYNQLLSILTKKMHQEKVQQEKLKAVKARFNFEEASQYSESGAPSRRGDVRNRLRPKDARSISRSPEPRHDRSRSPRRKDPERKTVFRRLEKGVFHRLGDKEKGMSAYSGSSRRQSYHNSREDTESYYQNSRSRGTEPAPKRHHDIKACSRKGGKMSESEDIAGEHWKSKYKKKRSSMEDKDLSRPWVCEETDPFMPRIRYFDLPKRIRMPSHVKTYDGMESEDHLKDLSGSAKIKAKQWKTPSKGGKERRSRKKGQATSNLDGEEDGTEGPMVIEVEVGGHLVHLMYVDGGASSEILIIGRPGVRRIKAIPSTAHGMLKFLVKGQNLDIFAWKPSDMIRVPRHIAEHRLNVREGCFPVRQKKRGQASERNKAICEEVEKLVNAGIMKEVYYHSWLSNSVMVKKYDNSWRMYVDFKDLNKACPKDGYPLPEIDWKVESLCGYPFKCFLDAYKGYHQIKMAKEDEEKIAFISSQGIFRYSKMPFGLKNVGATYQRLVDKAFQKQIV